MFLFNYIKCRRIRGIYDIVKRFNSYEINVLEGEKKSMVEVLCEEESNKVGKIKIWDYRF